MEKLDISSNTIDNEGLITLAEALSNNRGLETLAIAFNPYTMSGLTKIFHLFNSANPNPNPKNSHDGDDTTRSDSRNETQSAIVNLSFSVPKKFENRSGYAELGTLLLKTLASNV